jgi:hypothetical protein
MPGHIGVSPVDHRLVKARLGNTGLQIVADRLACRAIKIGEGANVRGDPIRKGLAPYCLGVGEARRAERGDKDLHRDDLATETVDHLGRATGKVDKQLLAGNMDLAQGRLQPADPALVQIAEPGIAEPVGCAGPVLLPQQRQRHIRPAQLAVHPAKIGHRPLIGWRPRRRRKQSGFKLRVIKCFRQRPGHSRATRPTEIFGHRCLAQPQAVADRSLR